MLGVRNHHLSGTVCGMHDKEDFASTKWQSTTSPILFTLKNDPTRERRNSATNQKRANFRVNGTRRECLDEK
jgi:hypothetical protein